MPLRLLYRLRSAAVEPGRWLGSWRLSIALMVSAALYSAFLAIWASSSPPHVVANIARLLPFWLVYVLILANTGVCLWRRLPALRRQVAKRPVLVVKVSEWEVVGGAAFDRERACDLMRRKRFRLVHDSDHRVVGLRRRWAPLGTFLFHGAFFLVAAGFLLSMGARQESTVWVAVGEEFTGESGQFLSRAAPRPLALAGPVPAGLRFEITDIRPAFWRDQLLFTSLEADLTLPSGPARTRINRPLWVGPFTFLRLSGFGYAPRYELRDRQDRVLDSAFVKLNLFPPGQSDYFRVETFPHRFELEVLPDLTFDGDEPVTDSLNLVNPGVIVHVSRGKLDLARAVLAQGQSLAFEGLKVRFPEIRTWGELSIVRDPGIPVLFAGYLLGLAGLALRVRGPRGELEWLALDGGERAVLRGWGCRPVAELRAATRGERRDDQGQDSDSGGEGAP